MIVPRIHRPLPLTGLVALLLAVGCGRSPEEHLKDGVDAFRAGKYMKARESLTAALRGREQDPAAADSFNLLGVACHKLNDPVAAEAAYQRSQELNHAYFEPLYNLGVLKCGQDAFEVGAQWLRQAAEVNPQDTFALEFLAGEHRRRGQWVEAQTVLMNALGRAPEEPRVLSALAISGLNTEGAPYALSFLKKALRVKPDYAPALFSLGRVYAEWIKEPSGALQQYRAFLSLPVGDSSYRKHAESEVARLEKATAEAPPAAPVAEPAIELRNPLAPRPAGSPAPAAGTPANPVLGMIDRARQEAQAGRGLNALNLCLEAAQKASSENNDALELKALQAATTLCADQPKAHFALGRWYSEQGKHREAMESYRQASLLEPTWSKSLRAAAGAAIECGEFQYALEALRQAVKVDPDNADALWALALFYDSQLHLDESARQAYDRFITSFPQDSRSTEGRRRMETLKNKGSSAPRPTAPSAPPSAGPVPAPATARLEMVKVTPVEVPTMTTSRTLTPKTPLAATPMPPTTGTDALPEAARLFKKAVNHQQRGELDTAVDAYNQSLAQDPNQASAHYNLGLIFQKMNQPDAARQAFEQAVKLDPAMHAAHYQIGSILASLGRPADAAPHFQSVLARNPDHALANLGLGRVYETSDPAKARAQYSRFLELSPNDPEAPRVRRWLIQQ